MGHRIGAHLPGHLHQPACDQGAGQGSGERIAALVERIGPDGGEGELTDERIDQIVHQGAAGAGGEGLEADGLELVALAEIGGEGDHLLHPPFPHQVGNADAGVDTAGIGENHPPGAGRTARRLLPHLRHQ